MKIVLCDDHLLFLEALAGVLESRGFRVIASVLHPDDAVAWVRSQQVDICVMDFKFPSGDGLEGARRVIAASPTTRVVMLSGYCERTQIAEALAAGVAGLALKNDEMERIIKVLERVHAGEMVFTASALRDAVGFLRRRRGTPEENLARFLTAREAEVLIRLVRGESSASMARELRISYATARTHVQNILTKLGVHSRLEALAFAVRNSLVRLTPGELSDWENSGE
ncbi:MAG: response regulator transcription factor [Actinomycetota bacterium]